MQLIGVDGCRAGWVAANSDETLRTVTFSIVERLETLLSDAERDQAIVAIDMPIGLSDGGLRNCEQEARQLLGSPRCTSVFSAPCRATLAAMTFAEACALNRAARGVGISQQLFGILKKIAEADAAITPARQAWVYESHPEVIFATLAGGGRGLSSRKKTADGERERLDILSRFLPAFDLVAIRGNLGRASVARDDIIDAAACLVTASRLQRDRAVVLPKDGPQFDARGLRMEIVA